MMTVQQSPLTIQDLSAAQRKRAVIGGSFDPLQNAHVAQVEKALADGIQVVTVVPAFQQPQKNGASASFADRVEMLKRGFKNHPGVEISEIEATLPAPSYTIQTLRTLFPGFDGLTERVPFIGGTDILTNLATWKEAKALAQKLVFLVFPRGDEPVPETVTVEGESLPVQRIILNIPKTDTSSTMVRERRKRGENIRDLVPEAVADYIEEKGLYIPATVAAKS